MILRNTWGKSKKWTDLARIIRIGVINSNNQMNLMDSASESASQGGGVQKGKLIVCGQK